MFMSLEPNLCFKEWEGGGGYRCSMMTHFKPLNAHHTTCRCYRTAGHIFLFTSFVCSLTLLRCGSVRSLGAEPSSQMLQRRWGSDHSLVTSDGLQLDDSSGTQGEY